MSICYTNNMNKYLILQNDVILQRLSTLIFFFNNEIMPSNAEDTSDQENIENKIQIEEDSTYPLDNNIIYRERMNKITKRSFNYIIIKEGVYPNGIALNEKNILETSNESNNFKRKLYKIPHGYVVKTTWGR